MGGNDLWQTGEVEGPRQSFCSAYTFHSVRISICCSSSISCFCLLAHLYKETGDPGPSIPQVLVFVCSRIYTKRRVIQDLQFRRLAGADDGDEAIDGCRLSGDEDDEQRKQSPPLPSLPAENEGHLPLKKRILLKAAGSSAAGEGSNPQQEEQQQQHDEAASPPVQPASRPEQRGSSPRPVPSSPSSAQGLTSEEVDAATGVLHLPPHQEAAPSVATGESRKHEVEVKRLQRQVRKLRRQLRRERRHHQWVLRRLQRQDEQAELVQRQQQQQQQQQHLQLQYLQWKQLHHQQVLLQTVASQQQLQRPLQRQEQQSPVQQQQIQDQTQSSEQQQQTQEQKQDATVKEKDRKRRRERQQEEAEQPEAKRQSPEDEWVDSESEEPQPSSSQQALQQSVAAAEAAADGSPLARELTSVLTRKSEEPRDPGGIDQHPFVRLPRRMVATVPSFYLIDFRNAMLCNAPRRDALPLLAR
ncbi:LOW QUALITY PROTEIN: uncharacterized protein EMH_0055880 [Eimeria mitis]|uniref:Uncharacterized protein n=1 Tax=Eimeria mitis TaxID=44415 RepID=U6KIE2_9EIME|nr:LOW QUALITY PROTEIN: uncharacterized protein EMH_0055880 [Eimeria mitis]CDJ36017.1 hypothetical protein EMH_0055880 [Eimeria mitis]